MERTTAILTGRVGSDVAMNQDQQGGTPFARFRLVVPRGRWNDQGTWEEQEGGWYTIKAWGNLALNMHQSLRKGNPVIVVGRPSAQGWINKEDKVATEIAINASAIGHDLARGISTFGKVVRDPQPAEDQTAAVETAEESKERGPDEPGVEDGVETATVVLAAG